MAGGATSGGSWDGPGSWDGSGGSWDGPGDDGLVCPTCEKPLRSGAAAPTAPLVEPIPARPPLLWLKVLSAALGAGLLLGGTALAAYRYGISAAGSRPPDPSEASLPTATPSASALATAPASAASTSTTSPLGSYLPTSPLGSLDDSISARLDSLRERMASGLLDGMGTLDGGMPDDLADATGPAPGESGPAAGESDLSARATLGASSVLPPARGFTYVPANLVDGRRDTCWAEGAPGYGVGESVTFDFGGEVTVTRLEVLPGYDKRNEADRWTSNGRLKTAVLRFDDGATQDASFEDARRSQTVSVPSRKTRRLTIVIKDVYPASPGPHAAQDTSIGEIRVFGR
ncbi:MAG: discoidin domain-containing protein [Coriobacteriia bacterium]|nr:discoidin domain-containing protein [Coriobacteriia bacterium]